MSGTPRQYSARGRPRRPKVAGNLLQDWTSFVGREEDLRELKSALGRSRLITLVGPGGIGKSRLARELAGRVQPIFTGGVWLVELADVSNASTVAPAVARALGIVQHGGEPLSAQIAQGLQPNTLLILDNCEHVIEASAELASDLLSGSQSLRIVATSREPLEIKGETTFAVAALPVPVSPDDVSPADYAKYPGLELFVDRVFSRDRTFRVTDDNLPLIASLCASVGGMPLALELAAGRASRVTLSTLAGQIEEQLSFESLHRDSPERHRSMRAALRASFDTLPPEERELWKRLSIFSGGATLAAARAVCGYGALEGGAVDIALDGLMERSIVSLDSATPGGRYRMLEPVRLFGLEQAALAGEEAALRRAHLEWCANLIPPDAWLTGTDQLRHMRTFQAEHPNIAAALDHCLAHRELAAGLDLFAATFSFWGFSGWYREEHHYAEALLEAVKTPSKTRTLVLFAAGVSAWYTWEVAQRWYEETQAAAGSDPRGQGLAQFGLGYCAIMAESYDRAITLLERACELLEASETPVTLAQARYALSQAHAIGKRDYDTARAVAERNLALAAPGDIWNRGMTHAQLGLLDWRVGALDDAESHLVTALELQTRLGNRFGIAASLEYLAWVSLSKDEPARAAQLLGHANGVFERIGTRLVTGLTDEHEHGLELIRRRLGTERFRALHQAGARMQIDEIVGLARRQSAPADGGGQLLTDRELEVAALIAKGATNLQISLELLIAHETVKSHVRSILRKLDFESRVQVAAWYGEHERLTSRT
jgi:non-specific serine/threonine protein kinase